MARFRIVGTHSVEGVRPGDVLTVTEDTTLNLGALLTGGHLELLDEPAHADGDQDYEPLLGSEVEASEHTEDEGQ